MLLQIHIQIQNIYVTQVKPTQHSLVTCSVSFGQNENCVWSYVAWCLPMLCHPVLPGTLSPAGEVRVIWLDVSMFECPMGARVVVVGVAGRGGLRWRGTRVVVVRCVLLAETAVGRPKK